MDTTTMVIQQVTKPKKIGVQSGDENTERGNWSGKLDFILACIGYAVGLGNVWRFPYLCYRNGGGAFLIPYTIMLAIAGLPLFFMELSFGQYASLGPITIWKVSPLFKGIGYGMVTVSGVVCIYYNVIISYAIFYLIASFGKDVPWKDCKNDWNTPFCLETSEAANLSKTLSKEELKLYKSPAEEYFENYVLDMSEGIDSPGEMRWQLCLCLLLAWIVVFLCIIKGVKSTGKVVYFTALFPYAVLLILLVRGVTLPGSAEGIKFYITPQFDKLSDPKVWGDAATQIFYSLGPAWGGLITMSSYNRFHNNCYMDAIIVAVCNCGTSVFAGFVIFSMIGYMANEKNIDVADATADGPGLAFVAYPEGIAQMPISPLWAILFFFMLWTLGLDSMFCMMETVISALTDEFKKLRPYKMWLTLVVSIIFYFVGLSMCTQGGIYVMNFFDWYSASYGLLTIALFEVLVLMQVYGYPKFADNINTMLGFRPRVYWRMCWTLISPMAVLFILLFMVISFTRITYNDYKYPEWCDVAGMMFTVLTVGWIPVFMAVALYKTFSSNKNTSCIKVLEIATKPTEDWGPALPEHWPDIHKSTQTDWDADYHQTQPMNNGVIKYDNKHYPELPTFSGDAVGYHNPTFVTEKF